MVNKNTLEREYRTKDQTGIQLPNLAELEVRTTKKQNKKTLKCTKRTNTSKNQAAAVVQYILSPNRIWGTH